MIFVLCLYAASNLQMHTYFQVSSEKEALLLQMFYHLKRSEEDYGELKDEPEYEMGRLMNELRRLVRN